MTRVPDSRAPEDWAAVLDALLQDDRVALARVTSVITGFLARYQAYGYRDSWEDICEEVLIRLVKSARRGAIHDPRAFVSYTGTTTRNVLLDWIARATKEGGASDRLERLQGVVETRDPGDLLDLQRALEDLPEKERLVVEALHLQGRSYEETALLLGMPLGTLKRLRAQALSRLRNKIGITGGFS
jgi:RNA polymerase sigma-70 factor (ECF subfamily)